MTTLAATERLTSALDAVARALAAADTTALLAAEEGLATALADASGLRSVEAHERVAVARQLAQARAALTRCRVLGRSAADAVDASLIALGRRSPDYNSSGAEIAVTADAATRGVSFVRRV